MPQTNKSEIVAFIFARGGSKGLPNKNIKPLLGKPLIGWSIEHAKNCAQIDRVIVSTDSKAIADVALKFGAEVPFMRPAELATDDSSEWLSWQHALNYLKKTEGCLPKIMLSIPTTAPLRSSVDIANALKEYKTTQCDVLVSITDSHRNPYFNMVKINQTGTLERVVDPNITLVRRQDAPVVYDMTTVVYVSSPDFVLKNNSIFDGTISGILIPPERAIDIDTELDFRIAEFLLSESR
jgi:N-acylneuraminate cytidylyltransferase